MRQIHKMPRPLEYALAIAADETLVGKSNKFWLGSVITRGSKKPIAIGWNKNRSIPENLGECFWESTTDAEIDAIKKCRAETLNRCTLYVARLAKGTREAAMARPCHRCESVIRESGIRTVIYTINTSQYGIWRLQGDQDLDTEIVRDLG